MGASSLNHDQVVGDPARHLRPVLLEEDGVDQHRRAGRLGQKDVFYYHSTCSFFISYSTYRSKATPSTRTNVQASSLKW